MVLVLVDVVVIVAVVVVVRVDVGVAAVTVACVWTTEKLIAVRATEKYVSGTTYRITP